MIIKGIGASEGIGIGRVVCIQQETLDYTKVECQTEAVERARLHQAIQTFQMQIRDLAGQLQQETGGEEADILEVQGTVLTDPALLEQIERRIVQGQCAERAVDESCMEFIQLFSQHQDETLQQRAADLKDIRSRLLSILLGKSRVERWNLGPEGVVVVQELTPSMMVGFKQGKPAAILAETGGRTSHAAILARALELPAVLGISGIRKAVRDGEWVIVDGGAGTVLVAPDRDTRMRARRMQDQQRQKRQELAVYQSRPTEDGAGRAVRLYANADGLEEIRRGVEDHADGIGLLRTELLFFRQHGVPTEEEQLQMYQASARAMAGRDLIIRTLDFGGDKPVPWMERIKEENPALGLRGIRYCLRHPALFKTQLRALLRAGAEERAIKMMLPMVTGVEEVRSARALLEVCKQELAAQGLLYHENIQLGVMIETPAAVQIAELLARECDFFSIGTNDLIQYIMVADRGSSTVSALNSPLYPAVLLAIHRVIQAGREHGIFVEMCGEAAADPRLIPLLLSWGLDGFSVGEGALLATRREIARWTPEAAHQVAERAMECSTAEEVAQVLGGFGPMEPQTWAQGPS